MLRRGNGGGSLLPWIAAPVRVAVGTRGRRHSDKGGQETGIKDEEEEGGGETMGRTAPQNPRIPPTLTPARQCTHLPTDLLLQLLLKLFDSPHCSLLLGSDLLLHNRVFFQDEVDQLSEHLLTVLQCFVSRLIDGLHLLLEQIHIFLAERTDGLLISAAEQLLHLIMDRADVLLELLGGLHQLVFLKCRADITGHIFRSSIAVVSRRSLESSLLQLLH
ncbi:unnamed protein product [Menidia menidia]|uniref:(Atlantic silverside) hypothetical protein n=1 Tax=Menidia menidia TaxID=238744 RepID=A0A8S4AT65_9TELE|nr:unnamed protein product [Menidia menidia]